MHDIAKQRIAVLGSGRMGEGISAHLLRHGFDILLWESDPRVAKSASKRIEERSGNNHPSGSFGSLKVVSDLQEVTGLDLVFEAIVEDVAIKKRCTGQSKKIRRKRYLPPIHHQFQSWHWRTDHCIRNACLSPTGGTPQTLFPWSKS